jgi:hypothetical protein
MRKHAQVGISALIFICGFALFAQTPRTFTSPDGEFQFQYSSVLLQCQPDPNGDGELWTPDSCIAYFPVCRSYSQGGRVLLCFAFPKARFRDYPTFEAATFVVAEIPQATNDQKCLTADPDWSQIQARPGKSVKIGRVNSKMFQLGEGGLSHSLGARVYRAFHGNTCYELSILEGWVSPGVFDFPVKKPSAADRKDLEDALQKALESFRFLK